VSISTPSPVPLGCEDGETVALAAVAAPDGVAATHGVEVGPQAEAKAKARTISRLKSIRG